MTEITDGSDQVNGASQSVTAPSDRRVSALHRGVGAVLGLAVAVGVGLRLWYLFHAPVNSDEAIVGLMARGVLHGHFEAFYWGQPYGGGEQYVVAPLFAVFGQSAYVLGLAPVLLSAAAAVLVWRIARRVVTSRVLALLAGVLVWLGPDAVLANSTREYGFRGVTLVCGLACLLFALRILQAPITRVDAAGLGLAAGLGWWSSPEIVYFLLPAGLIALGAWYRSRTDRRPWPTRLALGATTFVVGALPWIWANVRSGGASLKPSSFPGGAVTAMNSGYAGRLGIFFRIWLPLSVDLRHLPSGSFLFGATVGDLLLAIVLAVVVVALLACLMRRDRATVLAVAVLAFPFLFAAQPGTWFWEDGRYIVFLSPLLALVLVAGGESIIGWLGRRQRSHRHRSRIEPAIGALVMSAALAVAVAALTVATFAGDNQVNFGSFASGWSDPDGPVVRAIATLQAQGVVDGYADYWVAYKIDLLDPHLTITPAPGDVDRSRAIDAEVARSPDPAWLFVPAKELAAAYPQFSFTPVITGPRAITEPNFVAALDHLGISHRTVPAGLLTAVVPGRPVTIREVLAAGA